MGKDNTFALSGRIWQTQQHPQGVIPLRFILPWAVHSLPFQGASGKHNNTPRVSFRYASFCPGLCTHCPFRAYLAPPCLPKGRRITPKRLFRIGFKWRNKLFPAEKLIVSSQETNVDRWKLPYIIIGNLSSIYACSPSSSLF